MNCPRCTSLCLSKHGEITCWACGWEYVSPRELELTRRVVQWESERVGTGRRRRALMHNGMKL